MLLWEDSYEGTALLLYQVWEEDGMGRISALFCHVMNWHNYGSTLHWRGGGEPLYRVRVCRDCGHEERMTELDWMMFGDRDGKVL